MSAIHAFTPSQSLHDAPNADPRRGRAAAMSIIPTSTGAERTIGKVIPELKYKLNATSFRVPVPDGSVAVLNVILKKDIRRDDINDVFQQRAWGDLKNILEYTTEPLVSQDIIGNKNSCVIDSQLTQLTGRMAKVIGWYDNELAYAARTAELCAMMENYI